MAGARMTDTPMVLEVVHLFFTLFIPSRVNYMHTGGQHCAAHEQAGCAWCFAYRESKGKSQLHNKRCTRESRFYQECGA